MHNYRKTIQSCQ
uniref:Uncharacterized protein n=1 Tax=Rhizophora mucronata TaxID=61149 RepID=A0A2P2R362_RHIMU